MLMKNFTATVKNISDTAIVFYTDEEGNDWYEGQKLFSPSTLKILFDRDNTIVASAWDASTLAPDGLSVTEIKKTAIPAGFFESGKHWIFDGKKIIPAPADYIAQAENQKNKLLAEATTKIIPLQDACDLDIATPEELADLAAWKNYRILLCRVDTRTAPDISWPEVPAS